MTLKHGTRRVALALVLIAGPAQARLPERLSANPSAVIAAEIGFNRLAREKGQWTAFRATAAKGAILFMPAQVDAAKWLNGRKDPLRSITWQPHKVFMSCDGTIGVSTGAWQRPDGATGWFTTVWQRQKKGDFKWLLDHGDTLATPRAPDEMIAGKVATCPKGRNPATPAASAAGTGQSKDGTLRWTWEVRPDQSRTLTVAMQQGDAMPVVLTDAVGPPP